MGNRAHMYWALALLGIFVALAVGWALTPSEWTINLSSDNNTRATAEAMAEVGNTNAQLSCLEGCYNEADYISKHCYEACTAERGKINGEN